VDVAHIGLRTAELTAQRVLLLTHHQHPAACTDNNKRPR